jgi:hypothetical protein
MDIGFLITTYNRQESCQRLVNSLQGIGDIVVVHDGNNYTINGATNINPNVHLGKQGYWRLVNLLFKNKGSHKYCFMLPDDFMICDSQIANAIEIWESIKDPQKICLNLFADRIGKTCWTQFKPRDKGEVWQTGWVDMCFICEERFFEQLETIPPISLNWRERPYMSSGVGAYISKYLYQKGLHFYQVKDSLVTPQDEHYKSEMKNSKLYYDKRTLSDNPIKRGNS